MNQVMAADNARCTNTASNRVGPIIYVNQGSGTFSNDVDVNPLIDQENNCGGNAQCSNDGSNLFRLINWNQAPAVLIAVNLQTNK